MAVDRDEPGRSAGGQGSDSYVPPAIVVLGELEDTAGVIGPTSDADGFNPSVPL